MKKLGFKFVTTAACLAMALVLTAPASAATYNLGVVSDQNPLGLGGVLSTANPSDTLVFALGSASDLGGGLSLVPPIVFTPSLVFGLTSAQASFYSGIVGSGTLLGSLSDGQTVNFDGLAAGDYYVVVTGTAFNPTLGGTYAIGLMSTNAAPAPGPAGLAVALAGGACILLRRRRGKSAPVGSPGRFATA